MVDISWYIQHYPAIVHVLWGLYCRPDLYNSGGHHVDSCIQYYVCHIGVPQAQEFFRLSKMSYMSHSWMACWGHLSQVFWGMRGHLLVLLSVVSPLNQPREFGTSTVEYLSSNIIILSYVIIYYHIKYYHILSYIYHLISLYYHILSYIIIYDHILSLCSMNFHDIWWIAW